MREPSRPGRVPRRCREDQIAVELLRGRDGCRRYRCLAGGGQDDGEGYGEVFHANGLVDEATALPYAVTVRLLELASVIVVGLWQVSNEVPDTAVKGVADGVKSAFP